MKFLIIGGGAAGSTAGFEARRINQDIEITIITDDLYTHYSPCGLPFVISKKIKKPTDLIVYPPSLYSLSDIKLYLETKVQEIDIKNKKLKTTKGEFVYDKLLLATGSLPIIPPIKGIEEAKDLIHTLKKIEDAQRIIKELENCKSVVVIGAGLIGLELACAFLEGKEDIKVYVIEKEGWILPNLLDKEMAICLQNELEERGLIFYLGKEAQEILNLGRGNRCIDIGDEKLSCCMIILACGVYPNTQLAKSANIKTSENGAIKVDKFLQTSADSIYAAGDCAETFHQLVNQKVVYSMSMLGSTATRQGKIAAINAVLGNKIEFKGIFNTTITKLFDLEVGAVGLTEKKAKEYGLEVKSVIFEGSSKDNFFPGGKPIILKLIVESKDGRLLGAQIIGGEQVWGRLFALSVWIQKNATVDEIAFAETSYVPAISPTFDPITLATEKLFKELRF